MRLAKASAASSATKIVRWEGGRTTRRSDQVVREEPLEIRVEGRSIAVVMRTPGEDRELTAGFLLTEGIVKKRADIFDITHCVATDPASKGNVIDAALANPGAVNLKKLTRHVFTSSSCGVCSKTAIDAVRRRCKPITDDCKIDARTLLKMPARLATAQKVFKRTGGLHACALFKPDGKLIVSREDVGRHNALDKLTGWALLHDLLPLRGHVLLLSGRVSFEMMQKALAAGIPIVAAIGAPSSLAVEFARENAQTLAGFLRGESMNIYAGAERF